MGIAAIAPAADIANILRLNVSVAKRVRPYIAASYSRFYPDVKFEEAVRPQPLAAAREIDTLCGFLAAPRGSDSNSGASLDSITEASYSREQDSMRPL